jgi:RNA polymerase sigma-70 factor (ECF subfamily)
MASMGHRGEDSNPVPADAAGPRTGESEGENLKSGAVSNAMEKIGDSERDHDEIIGAGINGTEIGGPDRTDTEPGQDVYAALADLVERIRTSETDGMAELYQLFSKGIRFYLCRQLGPQELDDKVHDTFVVVVQAIRRGEVREPQRLMGFVRTIVRRQVAAHIDRVVHSRRDQLDIEATVRIADPRGNPEDAAIFRQRNELIQKVLEELGTRDREILTRFYLREQSQEQICSEMCLTETQFRLLKSRAKARFGELGRKKLAAHSVPSLSLRTSAGLAH